MNNKISLRRKIFHIDTKIDQFLSSHTEQCNVGLSFESTESLSMLVLFYKQLQDHCIKAWIKDNKITKENSTMYEPCLADIANAAGDQHTPPAAKMHAKLLAKELRSLSNPDNFKNTNLLSPLTNSSDISSQKLYNVDARELIFSRGVSEIDDNQRPALAEYNLDDNGSCLTKPFRLFSELLFG
jgi:hypothetical protein